mgnify:CR=1 FL=1
MKTVPIGDFDRRVVLLTKERGKISAFAKGARRQNSRLLAATTPFCFGEFRLYEGRTSYNIMEASISNYFETLREDFEAAYYGMYFMEIADYYTRENNDEKEMLKLAYQSLRALQQPGLSNDLIRYIYEIKTVVVNGEYPGIPGDRQFSESAVYALTFIEKTEIGKLYTFTVTEEVLMELKDAADWLRRRFMNQNFKSLDVLETIQKPC